MTSWPQNYLNIVTSNQTLTTTTETVVATLQVTTDVAAAVALLGLVVVTAGTGATSITLRIRADSLTGAVVGAAPPQTVTAGDVSSLVIVAQAPAGELPNRTFVLTATQGAATGNGTVAAAALLAFAQG